jgi:hypothetical protein
MADVIWKMAEGNVQSISDKPRSAKKIEVYLFFNLSKFFAMYFSLAS